MSNSLDRPLESPRHDRRNSTQDQTDGGRSGRGRGGRDYMSSRNNNNSSRGGGGGRVWGRGRSDGGRGRFGRGGGRSDGRGRGRGRMGGRGRGRFSKNMHSPQDQDDKGSRNSINFTSASNLANNNNNNNNDNTDNMGNNNRGSYGEILSEDNMVDRFRSSMDNDGSFIGRESEGRRSFDSSDGQHYRGGRGRRTEGGRGRGRGRYDGGGRGGRNAHPDDDRSSGSRDWQDRGSIPRSSLTDRSRVDWKPRGDTSMASPAAATSVPRFEKSYASIADDDDDAEEGECREDDKIDEQTSAPPPPHLQDIRNTDSSNLQNQGNNFHRSDGNENNNRGLFSPDAGSSSHHRQQRDFASHRPSANSYSSLVGEAIITKGPPLISTPSKENEREEGEWQPSPRMEQQPPPPPPPPPPPGSGAPNKKNRDFRSPQEISRNNEKRPDWQPPPHHQRDESNSFRTNNNINEEWQNSRNNRNNKTHQQQPQDDFRRGSQEWQSPRNSTNQNRDLRNDNQDWQQKNYQQRDEPRWQQPQQQRKDNHHHQQPRDQQPRDFRNENNNKLDWTPPPQQQRNHHVPRHSSDEPQDFRSNKDKRDWHSNQQQHHNDEAPPRELITNNNQDWSSPSQRNHQQQREHNRDFRNEKPDWQQQSGEIGGGSRHDNQNWQKNHQQHWEEHPRDIFRNENQDWQKQQGRDKQFPPYNNLEWQRNNNQQRDDPRNNFRKDNPDWQSQKNQTQHDEIRHEDMRENNRNQTQEWQAPLQQRDEPRGFQSPQHRNSVTDGNRDDNNGGIIGDTRANWNNNRGTEGHPAHSTRHYGPSSDMPPVRENSDPNYATMGSPRQENAGRGIGSYSDMDDRDIKRDHFSPSPSMGEGDPLLHQKKRRLDFDHDKRDSITYGSHYQRDIDSGRVHHNKAPYEQHTREEITRKTSFELHEERRRKSSLEFLDESRAREGHNHPPLDRPEPHFLPKPPMDRSHSTGMAQPPLPDGAMSHNSWQADGMNARGDQAVPDSLQQAHPAQSTFRDDGQFHQQKHYRGGGRNIGGRGRGFGRGRGRGRGNHYEGRGGGNYDGGRGFGRGGRGGRGSFGPEGRGFQKMPATSGFSSGPPGHIPPPPLPSADWQSSGGSYAALAASDGPVVEVMTGLEGVPSSLPTEGSESEVAAINTNHENESAAKPPMVRMPTPPPQRPPPSPPPEPAPPSAFTVDLARMVDAEAQLDYAYAKHAQIIRKTKILRREIETLEKLPVGYDAFKEDLEKLISDLEKSKAENKDSGLSALEEEEEALMEAYVNR